MEVRADVLLKATKVDGIYTADPVTHPDAEKLEHVSYIQVLERGLKVMDTTAVSLCMDNDLPIVVFNIREEGNIRRIVTGEPIGSVVSAAKDTSRSPARGGRTTTAVSIPSRRTSPLKAMVVTLRSRCCSCSSSRPSANFLMGQRQAQEGRASSLRTRKRS